MPRDYKVYLDDILQAVANIEKYIQGFNLKQFSEDGKTRDAVIRNLEIIGVAVKNIPQDVREREQGIEWKKIGALRDILAHEYFGIDNEIIWDVVCNKLPALKAQIQKLL
jgi:uncharacterized protein with HEPN domain